VKRASLVGRGPWLIAAAALVVALTVSPRVETQSRDVPGPAWGRSGDIDVFHVQGHVDLIVGAGGNIVVQTGDEGVLVVDTGLAMYADKVLATIRKLSDKPIRYIVNTHAHPDHTGGNEAIGKVGSTTQGNPTPIVAHENVLARMSATVGERTVAPTAAWPTNSYVTASKDFFFNGEPIRLFHDAAAHTDGDTIALFRRSDVLVAGDIFVTTNYPVIDLANGGGVQGVIDGLNRLLDLAVPQHEQEGGTYVVPGHGRICDEADVLEYRDMVTIVRDRVQDMIDRGLTVDQVKAARPTLDYDLRYGAASGPWTTAMFVETFYEDLSSRKR
jgi:cyclase